MISKHQSLSRILTELQTLRKEGRQRCDVIVQSVEKRVIKILNIHPKVWIDGDRSIDDVIEVLKNYCNELSIALNKIEDINTEHVVANASGGHALKGVLLEQSFSDLMTNRKQIINLPTKLSLRHEK